MYQLKLSHILGTVTPSPTPPLDKPTSRSLLKIIRSLTYREPKSKAPLIPQCIASDNCVGTTFTPSPCIGKMAELLRMVAWAPIPHFEYRD